MITAVLDTNVLVSGFVGFDLGISTPAQLLWRWLAGGYQLAVSEHIIAELRRALARPYFRIRLSETQVAEDIALLYRLGQLVSITTPVYGVAAHPEDDLVLATAVSAHADYLVTGDAGLLRVVSYEGVRMLSPRAFLDFLRDEQPGQ
jgi:putative PIN family toxin of toxin-antitoxin system